jgi:hypothetical protein
VTIYDPAGLMWFICHRFLKVLGQELTEILSKNKKIMAWEMDIVPRAMSRITKQDSGLSNDKQENALLLY